MSFSEEVLIQVTEIESDVLGLCTVQTTWAWLGLVLPQSDVCLGTDKPCRQLVPL